MKRQLQAGGLSDFRREVQAKIHINIGPNIDGYDGEVVCSILCVKPIMPPAVIVYSVPYVMCMCIHKPNACWHIPTCALFICTSV